MFLGLIVVPLIAILAVLVSPLFHRLSKNCGLLARLMSHTSLIPLYVLAYNVLGQQTLLLPKWSLLESSMLGLVNGILVYVLSFIPIEGILGKIDRSVSLKILTTILNSPNQQIALNSLKEDFSVNSMIAARLNALCSQNYVTRQQDNNITVTASGMQNARILLLVRRLFG